jgi:SAM-dependent methyltransferase
MEAVLTRGFCVEAPWTGAGRTTRTVKPDQGVSAEKPPFLRVCAGRTFGSSNALPDATASRCGVLLPDRPCRAQTEPFPFKTEGLEPQRLRSERAQSRVRPSWLDRGPREPSWGRFVTNTPAAGDFARDFETLKTLATAPAATAGELLANLTRLYHEVFDRDLNLYNGPAIQAAAPQLLDAVFRLRTTLRDRIPEWQAKGLMTRDVQRALRDAMRVLRYATDFLGELNIRHDVADEDELPMRAFREKSLNTLVHPKYDNGKNITFRSGDVILVRGTQHNSAAIARIGDIDSQFSHVSIVHIDDAGKTWVVESLIEDGAVVTPLKDALQHGVARAILLRHHNTDVAARASKLVFDHVHRSLKPGGRRILYDFSMRMHNYNELFCSKLIRLAYEDATKGNLKLPTFTTRLDAKNRDFFKRVGVKAAETFAPGDLEIDPQFDLIAEWQDYRFTSRLRKQDLIMTKLFEWMEAPGYKFQEDFTIRLIAFFGRLATKLFKPARDLVFSVVPKIPPNMSKRTIGVIAMLHKTAQPMLEELQHLDRVRILTDGKPLHPREVYAHLEEVRQRSRGVLGYLVAPRGKV